MPLTQHAKRRIRSHPPQLLAESPLRPEPSVFQHQYSAVEEPLKRAN
ncbi:MAG: hypothetical protein NT023_11270 [Armatimonadetes bacterium]|nr:hypothetical protein [Armatimonadota bacterium]